jgi:hypothetical protein
MQTPPWMPDSSGMTVAPDRTTRLDAIAAIVIPVKTGIHAALDSTTRLDANTALDARLLATRIIGYDCDYDMIIGYKSSHWGFSFSMSAIFQARFHFFNCFSLVMASSMVAWVS